MGHRLLAWIVAATGIAVAVVRRCLRPLPPRPGRRGRTALLPGPRWIGFGRLPTHGGRPPRRPHRRGVRRRPRGRRACPLGRPRTRAVGLSRRDHPDHARGRRPVLPDASQLSRAVSFLRQHPSTVLVTVDVGFNDMVRCLAHHVVDEGCVDLALANVRTQLPQILAALRAAARAQGADRRGGPLRPVS